MLAVSLLSRRLWRRIHVHKLRSKLCRELLRVNGSHLVHWATVARTAAGVELSHSIRRRAQRGCDFAIGELASIGSVKLSAGNRSRLERDLLSGTTIVKRTAQTMIAKLATAVFRLYNQPTH